MSSGYSTAYRGHQLLISRRQGDHRWSAHRGGKKLAEGNGEPDCASAQRAAEAWVSEHPIATFPNLKKKNRSAA